MAKVSKEQIKAEIDVITHTLEGKGDVHMAQIRAAFPVGANPRTIQRRLDDMMAAGLVEKTGKARATRYRLLAGAAIGPAEIRPETEDLVPLSAAGKEILEAITLPEAQRHPVSYRREFLDTYHPNQTAYLSAAEKEQLATVGQTSAMAEPAGTYVKQILQRLLIDLSWNSSRLEGNNYSLLDTERLIDAGEQAPGKSAVDTQMILNHKDAIEFIAGGGDEVGFNRYTILNLHALLSGNLLPDPSASGRLRRIPVAIHGTVYMPTAIPQLIEERFDLILEKASRIVDPFEQAFFAMVQLPYLQPFDDVNKRVSRLAVNIPFRNRNLSPLSFTDVPRDLYTKGVLGVYELNRTELLRDIFIWAYGRSAARYASVRQSLGEPDPFRLKYRSVLKPLITELLSRALSHGEAFVRIREQARDLPRPDQQRFIDAAERELSDLHDGNFARYSVTPAVFQRWKEVWGKQ